MKRGMSVPAFLILVSMSFMASCAPSMKPVSTWKDEAFHGEHFKKVLVIAAAEKPGVRRFLEDEFVDQLRARGENAAPSYTFIPIENVMDKETIVDRMKGHDIDAVLITRLVSKREIDSYRPAGQKYGERIVVPLSSYADWYQYYADSVRHAEAPTYTVKREVNLETNLYEAKDEKLIWSRVTRVTLENERDKQFREYVTMTIRALCDDKMLR
jgi:hypothetical protein